jgi:hypothetical protein
VLSARADSMVDVAKFIAVHHAGAGFRLVVTAFGASASVDNQSPGRAL